MFSVRWFPVGNICIAIHHVSSCGTGPLAPLSFLIIESDLCTVQVLGLHGRFVAVELELGKGALNTGFSVGEHLYPRCHAAITLKSIMEFGYVHFVPLDGPGYRGIVLREKL